MRSRLLVVSVFLGVVGFGFEVIGGAVRVQE